MRCSTVVSVEAGGGSKDELGHLLPAGIFEQVEGPKRVGIKVAPGIGHALAHASHGSQVDDSLGIRNGLGEQVDNLLVGDIGFEEGEGGLRKLGFADDVLSCGHHRQPKDYRHQKPGVLEPTGVPQL